MRQIKFIAVLVLFVGLGATFYWLTTKSVREAENAKEAEKAVEQMLLEEAPADTAVADTLGGVID